MTGEDKSYTVDTTAMIETIKVINGESFASNSNRDLTADEVTITYTGLTADNKITAPANGEATFSVKIEADRRGQAGLSGQLPGRLLCRGLHLPDRRRGRQPEPAGSRLLWRLEQPAGLPGHL